MLCVGWSWRRWLCYEWFPRGRGGLTVLVSMAAAGEVVTAAQRQRVRDVRGPSRASGAGAIAP